MKIDDLGFWKFSANLTEGCLLECPECGEWVKHVDWIESEVGCEDCGSHDALECPACGELFDHVWSPIFNVKEK